jgi:hypothetical protein
MPSLDHPSTPDPAQAEARRRNDRLIFRALAISVLVGIAADVVLLVCAATLGGVGAVPGTLIGSGLALVVTLPTLLTARLGRSLDPTGQAMMLGGAWLVKMFVVIIVLLLVQHQAEISRPWLGGALLVGAVTAAVVEAVTLVRTKPRLEVASPTSEQRDRGPDQGPRD